MIAERNNEGRIISDPAFAPWKLTMGLTSSRVIHDDVIICAYVTIPFDPSAGSRLRVTCRGEPVEPCAAYYLGNDSHAHSFMTL
jgi:hypothetical protein